MRDILRSQFRTHSAPEAWCRGSSRSLRARTVGIQLSPGNNVGLGDVEAEGKAVLQTVI